MPDWAPYEPMNEHNCVNLALTHPFALTFFMSRKYNVRSNEELHSESYNFASTSIIIQCLLIDIRRAVTCTRHQGGGFKLASHRLMYLISLATAHGTVTKVQKQWADKDLTSSKKTGGEDFAAEQMWCGCTCLHAYSWYQQVSAAF